MPLCRPLLLPTASVSAPAALARLLPLRGRLLLAVRPMAHADDAALHRDDWVSSCVTLMGSRSGGAAGGADGAQEVRLLSRLGKKDNPRSQCQLRCDLSSGCNVCLLSMWTSQHHRLEN